MSHPCRSLIAASTAGALALAGLLGQPVAQAAPAPAPMPTVTPTPQSMARAGGDLTVPGRVEVVVDSSTDPAARRALRATLTAHGVGRVDERTRASGTAPLTIHLGPSTRPDVRAALAETVAPDRPEAYGLRADASVGPLGTVALGGADAAGQFYAVQSLRQLFIPLNDGYRLAGASISDYPSMPLRGTIEGFYGTPWTHADRLRQVGFLGAHKLNTYVYAPKDDPYHRDRWREPYPADKLAQLAELVQRAVDNHVRFTFALSPGNTVCYSGDEDFAALTAKATQMWDIGVRSFALLLDDIDPGLRCAADRERFGADESPAAAAQAHLLNRFRTEFLEPRAGAARLMTVPTEYGQPTSPTPYTRRFAGLVHPDVLVMWTGTSPFGPTSGDDVRRAGSAFGHEVLMWDNYPVNDFAANRLFLGPLRGRGADLAAAGMAGYVSNPMNQAAASEIPLFTVADYTWNPPAYDPDASWDAALREIGGRGYDALRTFAENSQSWYLHRDESPGLTAALATFWQAYESGRPTSAAAAALRARLDELEQLPTALRTGVADESLLEDIGKHVDKLAVLAKAANSATRMLVAQENGDGDAVWQSRAVTQSGRAAAAAMSPEIASVWTEIGRPGRSILDEFVARALRADDRWLGLRDSPGGQPEPVQVWDFDRDGDTEGWVAGNSVGPVSAQNGALTTQVTGDDPYLVQDRPLDVAPACQGGLAVEVTLQVESGGRGQIYWATQARPGFAEDKMTAFEVRAGAPASYRVELGTGPSPLTQLRLDLPDNAGQVRVEALRIVVDRPEPRGVVTGGPPATLGSALGRAVDGCLATSYDAAREPRPGEALTVELARPGPLEGVAVLQDPQAPAAAEVQVRSGGSWRTVGPVGSGYGQVAVGGTAADAIRLVWATGTAAPSVVEVIPFYADVTVETTLTGPADGTVEIGSSFPAEVRLTSTSLATIEGRLDIAVPDGWQVDTASRPVSVPRGRDVLTQVQVTAPAGVPAGRYELRATVTTADGHRVTRTTEVQVVPRSGDTNLAPGGAATASSVELGLPQFVAAHAIDADLATRWSSASTDGEWLQVELPQAARLARAVLRWEAAYGAAYRVQVSTDATSWTEVAAVMDGDGGVDEVRFDSVQRVRFLRIQGVERGTQYGYSLYELEVYGAA
ncbi:beta-N-acetylglucosaminidase domain-containing protein [Actinopolymorpha alba]|uniref:beta-N-acetylglucosaminidase domain-containing protein n=1 Tax=Actinopolymorpha alba TaxID=533267 RepID=UPI000370A37A|nr:beta-N-acetylglucosaminidase domain-containing protein [Actinopolymorpha alba]